MPMYEYQCPKCGCRFEELVRASDAAPPCPSCGDPATVKLISAASPATPDKAPLGGSFGAPLGGMGGGLGGGCGGGGFS